MSTPTNTRNHIHTHTHTHILTHTHTHTHTHKGSRHIERQGFSSLSHSEPIQYLALLDRREYDVVLVVVQLLIWNL